MSQLAKQVVSRRNLLKLLAVGSSLALAAEPFARLSGTLGFRTATVSQEAIELAPGATDDYMRIKVGTGFTDLVGIEAEYRDAIAMFPFAMPVDTAFPATSGLGHSEPDALWERGCGRAQAFVYWQSAVATAACTAHLGNDSVLADRYLDILERSYDTAVRRAVIGDDTNTFVNDVVGNARKGDYAALQEYFRQ